MDATCGAGVLGALGHILLLSMIPVVATAAGAIAATVRRPSAAVRSGIQHFAAGAVFSVVAVELLPDVVKGRAIVAVTIGFASGIAVMLLVRRCAGESPDEVSTPAERSRGSVAAFPSIAARAAAGGAPTGMLIAISIDILLDGLLLGIAFAAGAKEGLLLTMALSLELLSLGIATATTLVERSISRMRAAVTATGLSLFLVVGAVIGDTVLHNAGATVLSAVLAFGCAALLFLVTEELLVEAHEVPETNTTTTMFFVGFLIFLVLGMLQ